MLYLTEYFESFFKAYNKYNFRDSEWFSGAYIDGDGYICVKYIEDFFEKSFCDKILRCVSGKIHFEKGRYSFRELSKLCSEIIRDTDNAERGIIGAGIDIKNNIITLAVTEDFRDDGTLSDRDEFSVKRFEWSKTDISLQPADKLTNGECFFSTGYPARITKNIRGIVTAGHLTGNKIGMPVFYGGDEIGSVRDFEFSSVMDASFIELNSSSSCSDMLSIAPDQHINRLAPELICGAVVEKYSESDGCVRIGRVEYPSFHFMDFKNIAVFTYSAAAGDSGAPILIPFASGEHGLVGIHLGTFFMDGEVFSYGRTAKDINERFLLELDV